MPFTLEIIVLCTHLAPSFFSSIRAIRSSCAFRP
jgi:hypothetical protein